MTLDVAIASENDAFDGEVYRRLLELLLVRPIGRWIGEFVFNGDRSVAKQAAAFLSAAKTHGIRHAILAVDNDGGAKRRPEHAESDAAIPFDIGDRDSCRECWLLSAIPAAWGNGGGASCVVVPVQTVETWLLLLRGHRLEPTPEGAYSYARAKLKREFFGKPIPPLQRRIAMATEELVKPTALEILRTRPSFVRFERRVSGW